LLTEKVIRQANAFSPWDIPCQSEHLRSQWREFSFAFNQITTQFQPGLSLSSMVKNWGKIVRGLRIASKKRKSRSFGLLRPAKQVSAYGAKPLERGADFF